MNPIRLSALAAIFLAVAPCAAALERFAYCGTLQIAGLPKAEQAPAPVQNFLLLFPVEGLYVGPTGTTPMAPRTCVHVILGEPRGGHYVPEILVWSDVPPPIAYHADIYSSAEGIFGHREEEPSDYTPKGLEERTREMEAYLEAAAGEPVLRAVLEALRAGRDWAELERELPVPLPEGAGMTVTMPVRYRLDEIRVPETLPDDIERLRRLGRERRHPHSPDWRPIRIPVEAVP